VAPEAGRSTPSLRDVLQGETHGFSLFQVLRLLEFSEPDAPPIGMRGPFEKESVRLRGYPSLAFPTTNVKSVSVEVVPSNGRNRSVVMTPILGLYGPDSPLADHITEDILHERDDETTVPDFLDIINHRLISLLYRGWAHFRLYVGCKEWGKDALSRQLEALFDLENQTVPGLGAESSMPIVGLLMQRPRSASGLQTVLRHYFPGVPLHIQQCIPRTVEITPEQRTRLGAANCSLGRNTLVGSKLVDTTGKFRVVMELTGAAELADFQPGGMAYARLDGLVELWCQDFLEWELQLVLREQDVTVACLSSKNPTTKLGVNSWLGRPSDEGMKMIVDRD
jgi:type VI secretion system protein ImpH